MKSAPLHSRAILAGKSAPNPGYSFPLSAMAGSTMRKAPGFAQLDMMERMGSIWLSHT